MEYQTVLIVDDEPMIREGLQLLIDWEEYGYKVLASAKNGTEGLDLIQKLQPDVVITDIRMPEMTGLEMVEAARKMVQHPFFAIILSGYSEFEYAQQAVSIGFTSYLLKPVDEEELIDILLKIKQQVAIHQKENLIDSLFTRIFAGNKSPLEGYQRINVCQFQQEIPQQVMEDLEKIRAKYVVIQNLKAWYVILLDSARNETCLLEWTNVFGNVGEVVSTGWISAHQDLSIVVQQILRKMEEKIFFFPNRLLYPTHPLLQKKSMTSPVTLDELMQLMMKNQPLEEIVSHYLMSKMGRFSNSQPFIWEIQEEVKKLWELILKTIQKTLQIDFYEWNIQLQNAHHIEEVQQLLLQKLEEMRDIIRIELNTIDLMEQILFYIDHHYQEELTLKSVANHFGYNSAYLGKKFKSKMSEPFLNYVEHVRMQKATELLKQSRLMVYEIAEKVGYKNIDYFYKKFKHVYGVSPNEFRRQMEQ